MPRLALDDLIPFMPAVLPVYVSLWIYVGFGPGLQRTGQEFVRYTLWLGALCVTGLGLFYLWPTQISISQVPVSGYPGFKMLHQVDAASNACPSLHVAVAVFTLVRVEELLRSLRAPAVFRVANASWCVLIAFSTLAIKQHVVLDVLCGALLGVIFALLSQRWRPLPRPALATVPRPVPL